MWQGDLVVFTQLASPRPSPLLAKSVRQRRVRLFTPTFLVFSGASRKAQVRQGCAGKSLTPTTLTPASATA